MLKDLTGFAEHCKRKIANNNGKIEQLRNQVTEYGTIIDIITRTDINNQILETYKRKIEQCFCEIDNYIQDNKNNYDLIKTMKQVRKIIKDSRRKRWEEKKNLK